MTNPPITDVPTTKFLAPPSTLRQSDPFRQLTPAVVDIERQAYWDPERGWQPWIRP